MSGRRKVYVFFLKSTNWTCFTHRLQAVSVTWSGTRHIRSLFLVPMKMSASGKWNCWKGQRPEIPGETRQLLMGMSSYTHLGFCYDLSMLLGEADRMSAASGFICCFQITFIDLCVSLWQETGYVGAAKTFCFILFYLWVVPVELRSLRKVS